MYILFFNSKKFKMNYLKYKVRKFMKSILQKDKLGFNGEKSQWNYNFEKAVTSTA